MLVSDLLHMALNLFIKHNLLRQQYAVRNDYSCRW